MSDADLPFDVLTLSGPELKAIPVSRPQDLFFTPKLMPAVYKKLSMRWHPDRFLGDEEVFKHLANLRDSAKVLIAQNRWDEPEPWAPEPEQWSPEPEQWTPEPPDPWEQEPVWAAEPQPQWTPNPHASTVPPGVRNFTRNDYARFARQDALKLRAIYGGLVTLHGLLFMLQVYVWLHFGTTWFVVFSVPIVAIALFAAIFYDQSDLRGNIRWHHTKSLGQW